MPKLLINLTSGPEHPTRAALGFLLARAGAEQGHDVTIFLAGDAVQLVREPVLDNLVGLGSGSLRESYDAARSAGVRIFVSGQSSMVRGLDPPEGVEAVPPTKLVELTFEADRVLTY